MKRLKRGILGLCAGGLFAISGCSLLPTGEGGCQPCDLRNSPYAVNLRIKADELSRGSNLNDRASAAETYGFLGELEKMDANINYIINKDLDKGLLYVEVGKKFHKFYKNK